MIAKQLCRQSRVADRNTARLIATLVTTVVTLVAPSALRAQAPAAPADATQRPTVDAMPAQSKPDATDETPDEPFEWDFSWRGWDGLHVSATRKLSVADPANTLPIINLDEVQFTGKVTGRLEFDGALFSTTGTLSGFDNGFDLRRARIKYRGGSIVLIPITYTIDIGYVPNQFSVTEANATVPDLPYIGRLKFGYFQPTMGLDLITSSWSIQFSEPAAPVQAIVPGTQLGLEIGRTFLARRGTWTLGLYGNGGTNPEYGYASEDFGNVNARMTWLAVDGIDADRPSANRLLHLGLSGSASYAGNGELRYRSRPESYLAPYVIDTGTINASRASTIAAELAWVDGPRSAQAELIRSSIEDSTVGPLVFGGFYATAGVFLTGESRPYNRETGAFDRVTPSSRFQFGPNGGWGALEAAVRYSYTDLSDRGIQGGRLSMVMTTLNWYLQPHLKWMLELGAGNTRSGATNGNMVIMQMRMGVDF